MAQEKLLADADNFYFFFTPLDFQKSKGRVDTKKAENRINEDI